jgi:deoxyadenosine/deoxycytidine kinase
MAMVSVKQTGATSSSTGHVRPLKIAIAGNIGAGKTTLSNGLACHFGIPVFVESVDDCPYMTDFYRDQKTWAFVTQTYWLHARYASQLEAERRGCGGIFDRSYHENRVFAELQYLKGNMTQAEYVAYERFYVKMAERVPAIDIVVYLRVRPETAYQRLVMRGRSEEKAVPLQYLRELHEVYERTIATMSLTMPVLVINWEEFESNASVAARIERFVSARNAGEPLRPYVQESYIDDSDSDVDSAEDGDSECGSSGFRSSVGSCENSMDGVDSDAMREDERRGPSVSTIARVLLDAMA